MPSLTSKHLPAPFPEGQSKPNRKEALMSAESYVASKNKLLVGITLALVIALIGAIVIFQSKEYGFGGEENIIGPGTAPVLLGALLIVGGLLIAFKDFLSLNRLKAQQKQPKLPL